MRRRRNTSKLGGLLALFAIMVIVMAVMKANQAPKGTEKPFMTESDVIKIAGNIEGFDEAIAEAKATENGGQQELKPIISDTSAQEPVEEAETREPGLPFTKSEIERGKDSFIELSELDRLGRCGKAMMSFTKNDMPTAQRGEIGNIKPTGWMQAKYDPEITGSDSPYLYNRCHLLAYMFSGLNDDKRNLITGTRQMNLEMLNKMEDAVADYVKSNPSMHILYRVIPVFDGNNLLASSVIMDAMSVEDDGASFNKSVVVKNEQQGVTIDYTSGKSTGPEFLGT